MIPILKTKRLILRPLSFSDQDSMIDVIMSDKDVMYWLPYAHESKTPEGQKAVAAGYIEEFIKSRDEFGFGVWTVCIGDIRLGKSGDFIGYCGFLPEKIKGAGLEFAYAIGKSMWNKGLITEAAAACLNWAFVRFKAETVYAVTDRSNIASRCVMEKLGMEHTKDVDMYNSVANGEGLLPFYSIEREIYFQRMNITEGI